MTEDEALKLKPGNRVEMKSGKSGWRIATVVKVVLWDQAGIDSAFRHWTNGPPAFIKVGSVRSVAVRSVCLTTAGRKSPVIYKNLLRLRPYNSPFDPITGNVFADWLEEHDFLDAANALRKAFPLVVEG